MAGRGRARHPVRAAALGAAYVSAVAAINALGLGPVDRDLSGAALRRGGLRGIHEVLRRLGISAPHVLFGHTHRAGPWPGDDESEWRSGPTRVWNTGSWVHQPHFLSDAPGGSPYWPGTAIVIEDSGPPRLIRLLGDRTHAELQGPA